MLADLPDERTLLDAPEPFDLARTLGPLKSALYRGQTSFAPALYAVSSRTPDGPGTIQFSMRASRVQVDAWGAGGAWLLSQSHHLLGFDDEPQLFQPDDERLRDLLKRSVGARWGKTCRVMEALIPAVIGQKVTGKGAGRSVRALTRSHGEPAPGPGDTWLLPRSEVLADLPYYEYHRFDIEKKRADTLRGVAARHVRLERLADEPIPEAYRVLQAFRGVGPWTTALVAGIALGDVDAVPVGDYHLPNAVAWALAGEERADDARMLELLEPYMGHRGRVIRLIKATGIKPPAYGPRNSVRSIRGQ